MKLEWRWWFFPLALTTMVFAIGWVGPEVEPIDVGGTHLLGLRFMPACTPFGIDTFCGLDYVFVGALVLMWVLFWSMGDKK